MLSRHSQSSKNWRSDIWPVVSNFLMVGAGTVLIFPMPDETAFAACVAAEGAGPADFAGWFQ